MVLREFVRAAKTVVDSGKWVTSVKRLPRTGGPFPMSRSRGLPLGAGWRWRALRIEAVGSLFRVMLAYRLDKPEFLAMVGADIGGDTLVLGTLAYRLHLALHAQATMVDTLGDNYREFNAQDLWAVFSLLAEEAERLHDALLPD